MGTSWDTLNGIGENREKEKIEMEGYIPDLEKLVTDAEERGEITANQRMELITTIGVLAEGAKDFGAKKTKAEIEARIQKDLSDLTEK